MGIRPVMVTAAVMGVMGVALGAFGAHALKEMLAASGKEGIWDTAVLYLLVHTAAMAFLPQVGFCRVWPYGFFLAGTVLFSGSLFLLAVGGPRFLVMVTPVGGLCLLAGWVALGWAAWKGVRD
ncbi:MAG: DUF423 domain-containing protein [Candidatus Methylacidiphilales bacterium]